ncbi:MAG: dihydrolipoamide acetyltransferase family protein [Acidimicrobiia bacterium]
MADFRMPSLGADMEAGTVTRWLVAPGDRVARGDVVAVVDTDKADVDVEIFQDGVIDRILVPEGQKVPVGTPLASVRGGHDTDAAPPTSTPPAAPHDTLSPVIRRLARHLDVALDDVIGSGPGGTITRADIEAAARAAPTPPEKPPDRDAAMRDAIGRLMARSKREIPHYYLSAESDFSEARAWLNGANAERPVAERILPAALLLKAVALATHDVERMNGFFVDDRFETANAVNVGVAIALREGGLVAPAIHDVDHKDLDRLMQDLRDLVGRARSGRLRSSEMSDPTITVTNLGDQGVDSVFGVIYPPQVALVGFGTVVERPLVVDGEVRARPTVRMTLAADHRVSDGHSGARLLRRIDAHLQDPGAL